CAHCWAGIPSKLSTNDTQSWTWSVERSSSSRCSTSAVSPPSAPTGSVTCCCSRDGGSAEADGSPRAPRPVSSTATRTAASAVRGRTSGAGGATIMGLAYRPGNGRTPASVRGGYSGRHGRADSAAGHRRDPRTDTYRGGRGRVRRAQTRWRRLDEGAVVVQGREDPLVSRETPARVLPLLLHRRGRGRVRVPHEDGAHRVRRGGRAARGQDRLPHLLRGRGAGDPARSRHPLAAGAGQLGGPEV